MRQENTKAFGFSGFVLKLIGVILMLLDHLYAFLPDMPLWLNYVGRASAPIFMYLSVEAFFHTSSRKNYLIRLYIAAAVMLGIDLLLDITNNIFLTLAVGVSMMSCFEAYKKDRARYYPLIGGIIFGMLMLLTEGSYYMLAVVLAFYLFRNHKVWMSAAYAALYVGMPLYDALANTGATLYETLFLYNYQWMSLLALPLILLYNGKPGPKTPAAKWMFYVIYPAHLIAFVLLGRVLM
ncbi:MAG: TraX family protein [Christensenellales bacterium]|jgi:hypothetical protein